MKKNRYLDGRGKGECLYDFKYDILTFKVKNQNYKISIEFQNLVIDINENDFITGIRLMDASKMFGVSKYILKNIKSAGFKASIEKNMVHITLKFITTMRNKTITLPSEKQNFLQQL